MLNNKKILMFTEWFEPGYKAGGPIQSCRNIAASLGDSYRFYVFTSDRDLGDGHPYAGIETDRWLKRDNNIMVWYSSKEKINFQLLKRILAETHPDIVYFNSMFSLKYTLLPLFALKRIGFQKKMILAPRGMLHKGALSSKRIKKRIFLLLASASGLFKNIFFHASDGQESRNIKKYFTNKSDVIIAGNIPNINTAEWSQRNKEPGSLKCVFISRIHPHKNLSLALAAVSKAPGNCYIVLDIYGVTDDNKYYAQCKELAASAPDNIKINFHGPLPHNELFEKLNSYHLFILPTLGENFGHIIFEALSSGCPVLISDQTPWNGVEKCAAGWVVPLNNVEGYTAVINHVSLMNRDEFNSISLNAKKYAIDFIRSSNINDQYFQLFE